ncbi:hypothetical protein EJB05_50516, partial [Eragrostis curvula]
FCEICLTNNCDGSAGKIATMIALVSSDNERFEVSEEAASQSQTIRNMIEDGCADGGIPLPNVTSSVLAKVLEYCNKHAATTTPDAASTEAVIGSAGTRAVLGPARHGPVVLRAVPCRAAGRRCPEGCRLDEGQDAGADQATFKIENDFRPEDVEKIRKENAWAFEE